MNAPETPLRVLIVEHQLLFANALANLLDGDGVVVAGIVPAPDQPRIHGHVDSIVFDIDNDLEFIDALVDRLHKDYGGATICALSMHLESNLMQRCLAIGMSGYVVKDGSVPALAGALRAIARGGSYVDPRLAADLLRRRGLRRGGRATELSVRETEIIRLIAEGLTNRSIGQRLLLSEKTVKNHVSRIFSKLHLSKRSQAAIHAMKNGLA